MGMRERGREISRKGVREMQSECVCPLLLSVLRHAITNGFTTVRVTDDAQ